ncbi:MAG: T9SS type A sorting domain-containing protein [Cytophagales bacterium]
MDSDYPNPTNGDFNIANASSGATLYVYNAQGTIVYTQKLVSEATLVNANLAKGIHLVRAGNATSKLVVE